MPRGDGRGPLGYGPGTGWGAGPCMPPRSRGYFGPRRRGFWGYGYRAVSPFSYEAPGEKEVLKQEAEILREQLKQVEARLQAVSASEQESE